MRVSESGAAYEADIATLGDAIAVVWYDARGGDREIYMRLLDGTGRPIAPARQLTDGEDAAYEPSAAPIDANSLAVAWYTKAADGRTAAYVGAWNRDGSLRWMQPLSSSPARNPVVRVSRLAIFTAWIQRDGAGAESIWRQWWTREGDAIGPAVRLAPASATTWNLNAAVDDAGSAWVVFDAENFTQASEVFLARDDVSGLPLERLTSDDGVASKYPDIAVRAGRAAIAWSDSRAGNPEIYLVIEALDRLGVDGDARAIRVTTTDGDSEGAYVAWNQERVGLAWSDTLDDGAAHEIVFQEFDAGRARSSSQRVTENASDSLIPAIRPWREGFVLAWTEFVAAATDHPADATSDVTAYLVAGQ